MIPHRLSPGDQAPSFTLPAADGSTVSLTDYRGHRVVVYFYPAAGTPGCTRQACDFRDSLASLDAHGYRVIGISVDDVAALANFTATEQLTFPLLADPDRTVHGAYGTWGPRTIYGKTVDGVIRSTFVINAEGLITLAQYNVKATGHVAKLRRDLGIDTPQR